MKQNIPNLNKLISKLKAKYPEHNEFLDSTLEFANEEVKNNSEGNTVYLAVMELYEELGVLIVKEAISEIERTK